MMSIFMVYLGLGSLLSLFLLDVDREGGQSFRVDEGGVGSHVGCLRVGPLVFQVNRGCCGK